MPEDRSRIRGEAAYRKVDASLGVPPPKPGAGWRGWPVIRWVLYGRAPGLWIYARLCLLLGAVSLVAGLLLGLIGAAIIAINFGEGGVGFAVNVVIAAFTFSTPGALFLVGSGVLAYLAARNDREARLNATDFKPSTEETQEAQPGVEADEYEDRKHNQHDSPGAS